MEEKYYEGKLSADLKRKYKHKVRHCYDNAYDLLRKCEVDYYVLGYVRDTEKNIGVRHCWGIKDNEIVDSTLGDKKEYISNIEYYKAFEIDRDNILDIMLKTEGTNIRNYNKEAEWETQGMLIEKFGVSMFF